MIPNPFPEIVALRREMEAKAREMTDAVKVRYPLGTPVRIALPGRVVTGKVSDYGHWFTSPGEVFIRIGDGTEKKFNAASNSMTAEIVTESGVAA